MSTVQVFAWDQAEGEGYTLYKGSSAIGGMFTQLGQDMNAAAVDGDLGLGVATEFPRVETAMEEFGLVLDRIRRQLAHSCSTVQATSRARQS